MIAIESVALMQSLINSASLTSALDTTADLFKRVDVEDLVPSVELVDKQAIAKETHEELAQMLSSGNSDDASETHTTGKAPRKLTRRQLKHREAMVRFRQRKKAKIAVLEVEELKLQKQLNEALRAYKRRAASQPPSVDDLLGITDRATMLRRAFAHAVMQIEGILDENEALEEAIAVHDKFHGTLKRVRERIVETSVWKCV